MLQSAGCAAVLCSSFFVSFASLQNRSDGICMPCQQKAVVKGQCTSTDKKGRREAHYTSQIHLPNSSPESKKKETISTVQFYMTLRD